MKTDLRSWLSDVEAHGELKTVDGADWNKEIGTVVELNAKARGPALLFDKIKDYPGGISSARRSDVERQALVIDLGDAAWC